MILTCKQVAVRYFNFFFLIFNFFVFTFKKNRIRKKETHIEREIPERDKQT